MPFTAWSGLLGAFVESIGTLCFFFFDFFLHYLARYFIYEPVSFFRVQGAKFVFRLLSELFSLVSEGNNLSFLWTHRAFYALLES